ncbi:membrane protein [Fructobacillus ficulneus]|uniref:Membrane protein n=1 Tax=Fructobacillus ficulneus TaxID=157463 RepID=A0A0K8MIU1_9LACO|nr:membrane protein [Fructobacillus ficulneus]
MSNNTYPSHERLLFASFLTMTAGSLDAYSYLIHGHVFAGLQTGNIILLGMHIGNLQFFTSARYLISILAFGFGTVLTKIMEHYLEVRGYSKNFERRAVLWYMAGILIISALIENDVPSLVGTSILSFVAAAELQEFRRLKGGPFVPLMMTGNIRTFCANFYEGIFRRNRESLGKAIDMGTVLLSFFLGVIIITVSVPFIDGYSIFIPAVIALIMSYLIGK